MDDTDILPPTPYIDADLQAQLAATMQPAHLPGPFRAMDVLDRPFLYEASLTGADFAAPFIHLAAPDTIPANAIIPGDAIGLSDGTWLSFASIGEFSHGT